MADVISALEAIVGQDHVLTDASDLMSRDLDGRGSVGHSRAFVRPADAGQIAEILRFAAAAELRVIPQGARTGLVGAGAADDSGKMILLGLDRLNAAPYIDPPNRTATVEAGVPLSVLNAAAAEHGLFFPIDLGADPSVGGMIAANTGGARFLRYGDVRRNVLGLDVVLADREGTSLKLGGALWKDNSGLDLKQMLIGSSGALGIVTRATLALQPLPAVTVTALIALGDARSSEDLLLVLEDGCGSLLTAFEGLSPAAYEAALNHVPRLRRPFTAGKAKYYVLVELSAGKAFNAEQLQEILGETLSPWFEREGGILDVAVDLGDALWAIRHAVPEGLRSLGHVIGCDIALRRGDVSEFRERVGAEILLAFPDLILCDFGHIGDGGLHFNMVWPRHCGTLPTGLAEQARLRVFAAVVEHYQGSFSAEHGIGPRNQTYYDRWTPREVQRLAGHIQSAFAPALFGRVRFGEENRHARNQR